MATHTHSAASGSHRRIVVRIKRQPRPGAGSYWQTFEVPYQPQMNVISVLQEIAANPVTQDGETVPPPAWDCNCLEEVCGACTMVVNGRVRQSCSALVDKLLADDPACIRLEPMTKFPVIRDLVVDRSRMFESLQRVRAWIPMDGYYDVGDAPPVPMKVQEWGYPFSQCMTCGCCLEACPQVNDHSEFMGAAPIAQAVLFNEHPTGKMNAHERLDALMKPGGIADCGNAQNCAKVCPKNIPLLDAIARAGRATTIHGIKRWLER